MVCCISSSALSLLAGVRAWRPGSVKGGSCGLAKRGRATCLCRDYYKAMCERKDQDMRSLERALQQQLAEAGQKNAHLGERELVLASEQVGIAALFHAGFIQDSAEFPVPSALLIISFQGVAKMPLEQLGCCCIRRHLWMSPIHWLQRICLSRTQAKGT